MTSPTSPRAREWWTRPSVVLPVVATVALFVALLTPQVSSGRLGDPRLTTHHAGSLGARVLFDLSRRLGWHVIRLDSVPAPTKATGRTIHAVLAPVTPIMAEDAHKYLEAVRGGDALLLVLDRRNRLSDSLGVRHFSRGGVLPAHSVARGECAGRRDLTPPLWADNRVHLWGVRWLRATPPGEVVFATLEADDDFPVAQGHAAMGFPYGQGRIVVVGDPDMLRNDVLRHCPWGADIIAVRMLEWLRAGGAAPRTVLAFDEYHQGFGSRPTVVSVSSSFLGEHPIGRMILQAMAAALVLLVAVAPRAIRPQDPERIERRDPLEQVDALAHAYEQVHATRTITARLVRGLRWRIERGSVARSRTDAAFLDAVAGRVPALAPDVALVRRALDAAVPDRDLPAVGDALRRMEHTLTTTST